MALFCDNWEDDFFALCCIGGIIAALSIPVAMGVTLFNGAREAEAIRNIQQDLSAEEIFQQSDALIDYFDGVPEFTNPEYAETVKTIEQQLQQKGIEPTDKVIAHYLEYLDQKAWVIENMEIRDMVTERESNGTLIETQAALNDYYMEPVGQTGREESAEIVRSVDEQIGQKFPDAQKFDGTRRRFFDVVNARMQWITSAPQVRNIKTRKHHPQHRGGN